MKDAAKATPMQCSTWRCEGLSSDEIEQNGREFFAKLFLTDTRKGQHQLHDGERVTFFADVFDHAFFRSPNKEVIDTRRIERIEWILPLIQGNVQHAECWELEDDGINKRIYVCFGLGYVVWLKETLSGGWKFLTAYPAFRVQIRMYLIGGRRIAKF
jgi:hypothetical protein